MCKLFLNTVPMYTVPIHIDTDYIDCVCGQCLYCLSIQCQYVCVYIYMHIIYRHSIHRYYFQRSVMRLLTSILSYHLSCDICWNNKFFHQFQIRLFMKNVIRWNVVGNVVVAFRSLERTMNLQKQSNLFLIFCFCFEFVGLFFSTKMSQWQASAIPQKLPTMFLRSFLSWVVPSLLTD